jgi:CRISPR-associated endonuclease Cas2
MGNIEETSKKRKSKQNIQKAILSVVEAAGVITLVTLLPNTATLLKSFGYDPARRQKEIVKRARENLVRKGLLMYKNGFLELTVKGQEELKKMELKDWKLEKPKKWDGRWRMLIFDIPEKQRNVRDKVRKTLLSIGFIKVQQSVWIYPYDCEDLVTLLKADFKIGKDLLYLIVDSMENDKSFRKFFGLPSYTNFHDRES